MGRNYNWRDRYSRRVVRDPNRSGDYRVLILHRFGDGTKDNPGSNEYFVVSNSGRHVKDWEYIDVHHRGNDIDEARKIMKRLSREWV